MRINLGCGLDNKDGYTNVDIVRPCDIIADFESGVLPFDDESAVEVNASQLMEHIHNFIPLMNEIYRILKVGGKLKVDVPIYPYREAFQDPTHCRVFTSNSFKYFLKNDNLFESFGKTYGIQGFSALTQARADFCIYVELIK